MNENEKYKMYNMKTIHNALHKEFINKHNGHLRVKGKAACSNNVIYFKGTSFCWI